MKTHEYNRRTKRLRRSRDQPADNAEGGQTNPAPKGKARVFHGALYPLNALSDCLGNSIGQRVLDDFDCLHRKVEVELGIANRITEAPKADRNSRACQRACKEARKGFPGGER